MIHNKTNLILLSSDPLEISGGDVDTNFPRVKEGVYELLIQNAEPKAKKDSGAQIVDGNVPYTGFNLSLQLCLTKDAVGVDGKPVYKGFPITFRVNGMSDKRDGSALQKDLAVLAKCALGIEGFKKAAEADKLFLKNLWNNPAQLNGKVVQAKVIVQPEQNGFPEKNEARLILPTK